MRLDSAADLTYTVSEAIDRIGTARSASASLAVIVQTVPCNCPLGLGLPVADGAEVSDHSRRSSQADLHKSWYGRRAARLAACLRLWELVALRAGFGRFQSYLLGYAGLAWAADACEMMLLSFVGPAVRIPTVQTRVPSACSAFRVKETNFTFLLYADILRTRQYASLALRAPFPKLTLTPLMLMLTLMPTSTLTLSPARHHVILCHP